MTAREGAAWQERPLAEAWWPEAWGPPPGWATRRETTDDVVAMAALGGSWNGLAASRRGRLHAHRAAAREDAVALRRERGTLVAACADGAGSRRWSRIGAALACETAAEAVLATLRTDGTGSVTTDPTTRVAESLRAALETAERALRELAGRHEVPPEDLRTTLLLGVVADVPGGTLLGAAQVGDGVIAVEDGTGAVQPLVAGDGGEYAGEVTHFLPDDGGAARAAARLAVRSAAGVRSLLLCTDGVDDCFYPVASMMPVLLRQLRAGVGEAAPGFTQAPCGPVLTDSVPADALARWLAWEKRGENDDRSLALLWAVEP
jgi:hypothetical protein